MSKSEHVVILHTDSRESVNKALQFKAAAFSRGIEAILFCPGDTSASEIAAIGSVRYSTNNIGDTGAELMRRLINVDVSAVIPCSDSLTWVAVEISAAYGLIPKTETLPFLSKSAGYNLFESVGFSTLKHHEVRTIHEIERSPIESAVFVKPDWSSGVHSVSPWGYKMFDCKSAFANIVSRDLPLFTATAKNPHARLMMMENVPHDGVYCISAIMREDKVACFGHSYMAISGNDHFYDYVIYEDIGNTAQLEGLIEKLWSAGFRSNFLYLQCLMRDGILYPMDVNTRLSTYLDTLATQYDPEFHGRALDFILGKIDDVKLNLPDGKCLIGRLRADPHKQVKAMEWPFVSGITPINFGKTTSSRAAYDKAYSWPTYVCFGNTVEQVFKRRAQFEAGVIIKQ